MFFSFESQACLYWYIKEQMICSGGETASRIAFCIFIICVLPFGAVHAGGKGQNTTALAVYNISTALSAMRISSSARQVNPERGKHNNSVYHQKTGMSEKRGSSWLWRTPENRSACQAQRRISTERGRDRRGRLVRRKNKTCEPAPKSRSPALQGQKRALAPKSCFWGRGQSNKNRFAEKVYSSENNEVFETSRKGLKKERQLARQTLQDQVESINAIASEEKNGESNKELGRVMHEKMPDVLGSFRTGKELKAYQEEATSGLVKYAFEYAGAFSRSLSDTMGYVSHHLNEFRSIRKFEHSHDVHILGGTTLNDYIGISLITHERGVNEYGQPVSPHISINFKQFPDPDDMPYTSDIFEERLLALSLQCRANSCHGLKLWPLTTLQANIGEGINNPFPLMLPGSSGDVLTFVLEWFDQSGDIIDSIFLNQPVVSGDSYKWLEQALQDHSIEQGREYVSLFSINMLENLLKVLHYGQEPANFKEWQLPCGRQSFQRFMLLPGGGHCKKFDGTLIAVSDINLKSDSHVKAVRLSKSYYLVLDYFGRLDYPAVLLVKI